jgi:hypothetical protein
VHGPLVDEAAQHQPPVHDGAHVPVEDPLAGGHQPDRGDLVGDQIGQPLAGQGEGGVRGARLDSDPRTVRFQAPRTAVHLDGQRPQIQVADREGDQVHPA